MKPRTTSLSFLGENAQDLPFRVPTLAEKAKEVELSGFYDLISATSELLTQRQHHNLFGNMFKPSALKAALGHGHVHSLVTFLSKSNRKHPDLLRAIPLSPEAMLSEFRALRTHAHEQAKEYGRSVAGKSPKAGEEISTYIDKNQVRIPVPENVPWSQEYIHNCVVKPKPSKVNVGTFKPITAEQVSIYLKPRQLLDLGDAQPRKK